MTQDVAVLPGPEPPLMPMLVTGERLKAAVQEGKLVREGDASSVEAVKYDFHMGSRILKALYGQPKDIETIPEENRWVDPGEAVFLLTRERLELPPNMMAMLTPKRKLAHSGIMMLGGLEVDPSYRGVLLVGLYNFSSTRYPLRPGAKLIGAVFYELNDNEQCDFDAIAPAEITDFPDDLVRLIQNYKPADLKGLQESLVDTRRQLETLRNDLTSDKQWREDIKTSLMKHDQQLDVIIKALDKEQSSRVGEDEKINSRLERMSNMLFGGRLVVTALLFLVGVAITALVTVLVTHAVDKHPTTPPAQPAHHFTSNAT